MTGSFLSSLLRGLGDSSPLCSEDWRILLLSAQKTGVVFNSLLACNLRFASTLYVVIAVSGQIHNISAFPKMHKQGETSKPAHGTGGKAKPSDIPS